MRTWLFVLAFGMTACGSSPPPAPATTAPPVASDTPTAPAASTDAPVASVSPPASATATDPPPPPPPPPSVDETDAHALETQLLEVMKKKSFPGLAALVSPTKGLRISTSSAVDITADVVLKQAEVKGAAADKTVRTWGSEQGSGDPIKLTSAAFFAKRVFRDYGKAKSSFNATTDTAHKNNIATAYPAGVYVDWYLEGTKKNHGHDWSALRVVMEKEEGKIVVVGLVLDGWIP